MEEHLDSERAEPGRPGSDTRAALADPEVLVVAVRQDGRVAVRRGLPDGVAAEDLTAPVLTHAGTRPVVALALESGRDDEAIAQFGGFEEDRAALLGLDEPAAALGALGFGQWRARTRFCPRCGTRLRAREDGRALHCDGCGTEHFPRLEPAVIMRVTDPDDRVLLGRQPSWQPGRFSVLAGFVDPGESIEDAVRREVHEEVGVTVDEVTYLASQPWPFPASLMLGYAARAATTDLVLVDEEIAEAAWFSRDELMAAMDAREVFVPPSISIASRLIQDWLGAPLTTWLDQRQPERRTEG